MHPAAHPCPRRALQSPRQAWGRNSRPPAPSPPAAPYATSDQPLRPGPPPSRLRHPPPPPLTLPATAVASRPLGSPQWNFCPIHSSRLSLPPSQTSPTPGTEQQTPRVVLAPSPRQPPRLALCHGQLSFPVAAALGEPSRPPALVWHGHPLLGLVPKGILSASTACKLRGTAPAWCQPAGNRPCAQRQRRSPPTRRPCPAHSPPHALLGACPDVSAAHSSGPQALHPTPPPPLLPGACDPAGQPRSCFALGCRLTGPSAGAQACLFLQESLQNQDGAVTAPQHPLCTRFRPRPFRLWQSRARARPRSPGFNKVPD